MLNNFVTNSVKSFRRTYRDANSLRFDHGTCTRNHPANYSTVIAFENNSISIPSGQVKKLNVFVTKVFSCVFRSPFFFFFAPFTRSFHRQNGFESVTNRIVRRRTVRLQLWPQLSLKVKNQVKRQVCLISNNST